MKIKFSNYSLWLGIFFLIPSILSAQSSDPIDEYFQSVREEFSGDNAYNTVAFVEKYWRIAGNEGFDQSIYHVEDILKSAGYKPESEGGKLSYRIEKRPMKRLTWEPVDASVHIVGMDEPLLEFATNRNMITVNSWSTNGTIRAEIVKVPDPVKESVKEMDIEGKILFAEGNLRGIVSELKDRGALGVMDYGIPGYLQPNKNTNSIQFRSIRQDQINKPWAIILSTEARNILNDQLAKGKVEVEVSVKTELYESEELTLIAEAIGSKYPEQRFVYSAHVQEPGANDNASGVGAQAEMARTLASLILSGKYTPDRTITFIFGDEIISTRRYIEDDKERAKNILWGMSLDMVGEDTQKTGGTFLIEKMPDPSAIWLRGNDKHTEWGGRPLKKDQIVPHYFNDLVLNIFQKQGKYANWVVNVNPFEGGSDHVPFLRADIPGLLLWHFTDAFYHTDGDRIDKVSEETLANVGAGAIVTGMFLASANTTHVDYILQLLYDTTISRLNIELELSQEAIKNGSSIAAEKEILNSWIDYYVAASETVVNISDDKILKRIKETQSQISLKGEEYLNRLK